MSSKFIFSLTLVVIIMVVLMQPQNSEAKVPPGGSKLSAGHAKANSTYLGMLEAANKTGQFKERCDLDSCEGNCCIGFSLCCGVDCCSSSGTCCGDVCCDDDTQICCKDKCCPKSNTCCNGACCAGTCVQLLPPIFNLLQLCSPATIPAAP